MGYWDQQSNKSGGAEDPGTWGWLTGSKTKTWTPDAAAYKPGEQYNKSVQDINQGLAGSQQPFDPNAANIAAARGQAGQGRGSLLDFLQQAQNRPLDSTALGQTMMRSGQQQVAGNIASQLASQQGRFNPASFRNAQNQMAGAGQGMALQAQQQSMAAAMQERAAREAMLQKGYQGLNENDIRMMLAEQQQRQGDQGFWGQQQQAQRGWAGMGLNAAQQEQALRQAYEQAKQAGFYGVQQQGEGAQFIGAALAAAGTAAAASSDVRLKRNIRPATSETRSLLELLAKEM